MARAIWTGIVTFGLVSIPVKLFAATESKDVSFHQLHKECKTRIKEMRWCPHCERQVEWEDIEKGFEYAKGEYVVLTPEDMKELPLPSKQTVSIQSFVQLDEIDPIFFDKSYYLEPDEKASKPFALFQHVLNEKGLVAIGTVAIRTKERYCCLRLVGSTLMLNTLLYPDEIRVDTTAKLSTTKPNAQEMKMAHALVDMMAQHFEPDQFKDNYREAIHQLVETKLSGGKTVTPEQPAGGKLLDLMDALRASVENVQGSKKKKPTSAAARTSREEAKPSKKSDAESAPEEKPKRTRKVS
jgi:DNA end-binding protein Ku